MVLDTAKRMEINELIDCHTALTTDHGEDSQKAQEIARMIGERLRGEGVKKVTLYGGPKPTES